MITTSHNSTEPALVDTETEPDNSEIIFKAGMVVSAVIMILFIAAGVCRGPEILSMLLGVGG